VLLAVVEHGSFSGAGRALNRAQSAVTHAIQRLEAQLGVALFDRAGYRPVLTVAGQALLPRARRLLDEADGLRAQARDMVENDLEDGKLRLIRPQASLELVRFCR